MPRSDNRSKLLAAGRELLEAGGSHQATGVQQITDRAGVPKGSFYNYFASKDRFGVEVLTLYAREQQEQFEQALVAADGPPLARLGRLFERLIEGEREAGFGRGCLAGNLGQEMAATAPEFREVLEEHFRRLQAVLAELLFEAQQTGDLEAGRDPAELAGFLLHAWQGALLRMKATRTDRPLQQFRQVAFGVLLKSTAS